MDRSALTSAGVSPAPDGLPNARLTDVHELPPGKLRDSLSWPLRVSITEKLDGETLTAYVGDDGVMLVAAGGMILSPFSEAHGVVSNSPAGEWLKKGRPGMFLQGELIGPSVRGNPLRLPRHEWRVFISGTVAWSTPYLIDPWATLSGEVPPSCLAPLIPPGTITRESTLEELVAFADGIHSMISHDRPAEGIVVRGYDDVGGLRSSFAVGNAAILRSS